MKRYYKEIGNKKVFYNGYSIITKDCTILNPSEKYLIDNGYKEYIEPQPKPLTKEEIEKNERMDYEYKVTAMIRERYTLDQEQAIIRHINDRKATQDKLIKYQNEFDEFNTYCEECKIKVKEQINNNIG